MPDVTAELDNLISLHNGSARDALNITMAHLEAAQYECRVLKARVYALEEEVMDLRDKYVPSGNLPED